HDGANGVEGHTDATPLSPVKCLYSRQGSMDAMTAPRPMKRACMANPRVRCLGGTRSATKARKGSMLMLMEASITQSSPAAIQSVDTLGMAASAKDASSAPAKK